MFALPLLYPVGELCQEQSCELKRLSGPLSSSQAGGTILPRDDPPSKKAVPLFVRFFQYRVPDPLLPFLILPGTRLLPSFYL